MDEWKENGIYNNNGILFNHKNKGILGSITATWMELEVIMLMK